MKVPSAIDGLSSLVEDLGHQLPALDAKRAGAELYGAPRLSPYELFRPNENALSRIIADLLDPRGTHGQGPLFLNALLGALGLSPVRLRDVRSVRREVLTNKGRRIDIVIDAETVLLGIENKPWAGQQENQLSAYRCQLESDARGRRFELVFLSDQEEESAHGQVIRMPYHAVDQKLSLHKMLSSTVALVRAARTRVHVEDLLRYIELEFGGSRVNEESEEVYVEAVRAEFGIDSKNRRALATVMLAQTALHSQILDEIGAFLVTHISRQMEDEYVARFSIKDCLKTRWQSWDTRSLSWPINCSIALEAENNSFAGIYFGIRALKPNSNSSIKHPGSACELRSKLETSAAELPNGKNNDWWPWFRTVGARNCWKAESAARFVLDSPTGRVDDHPEIQELARQMVELAEAVENAIRM